MIAPNHHKQHTPTFRLHKATGQGYVEIDGRRLYLGKHDLPETRQKYHQMIAEWLANGRQLPVDPRQITIAELVNQFRQHVEQHYRKPDGTPTSEQHNIRDAVRPLLALYGDTQAARFGPRVLKAVRQEMIDLGWCRKHVNKQVRRIKLLFKWAAENEMLPAETWHGLLAVSGLRLGRTEARESEPVQPVPEEIVEATLQHATPTLAAMIRLQLLTGMRPMEVCLLRTCDLDTTGRVWIYRPHRHKTEHHGHKRQILIGPRAQEVLRPFLLADLRAYVFSPARSEAKRRARMLLC